MKIHKNIQIGIVGLLLINSNSSYGKSWFNWFGKSKSTDINIDERNDILQSLQLGAKEDLKDKKIVITCKNAPNHDVPAFGFGDAFLYLIRLVEYLEDCGADVSICPPRPLVKFFRLCSDLKVVENADKDIDCIPIDCVDLLDNIELHRSNCKRRFLGKNNPLAQEARELANKIKQSGIIPILITRQSSKLPKKFANDMRFKYMDHRSMSRDTVKDMVNKFLDERKRYEERPKNIFARLLACLNFFSTPRKVMFYNIQFEDQNQPDIPGVEKPDKIYPQYKERRGAFINDLVLMKAALDAGGEIVSVDTAAGNVAIGVPDQNDTRKNIKFLLAELYNSRWKGKFVNPDGSSAWSQNIDLIKQKKMGDWSYVVNELIKDFKDLEGIPHNDNSALR